MVIYSGLQFPCPWHQNSLIFIRGCIPIHDDMMLLVRHYDENYEDHMYPHVNFVLLSEISLAYYEDDQDFEEE